MGNEDAELVSVRKATKHSSLLKKYDIPIDHLSFEYLTDCTDVKEVERIVMILRSGEEGMYPDLTRHAENRLLEICPKSKILRVDEPMRTRAMLDLQERKSIDDDMVNWLNEMHSREKDLEEGKRSCASLPLEHPEIRRVVGSGRTPAQPTSSEKCVTTKRIGSCDYREWDKFDPDAESDRIDLREERNQIVARRVQNERREKAERARKSEIEVEIDKLSLTATELIVMAENEKNRGNEAFKARDYEEALTRYNSSIKINPTVVTYNNRSITNIKLQRYQDAVNDCNAALTMEYNNITALLRRGLAFEHLEKKSQAIADYQSVLELEPSNKMAGTALKKLNKSLPTKKLIQ